MLQKISLELALRAFFSSSGAIDFSAKSYHPGARARRLEMKLRGCTGLFKSHRWLSRALLLLAAAAVLQGCVAPPVHRQTAELRREHGELPTVVLMPLDVELAELSAGGLPEPKSEWTDAAMKHMRVALEGQAKHYKVKLVDYDPKLGTSEDQATSLDLVKLHRAVGSSILVHQYIPGRELPSKAGKFDWSLGPEVAAIARAHDGDYALFIFVRDSYASAGRVGVIVVAALLGVGVPGGAQIGFASLVDLKTGDIVWFNRMARGAGDLRTPEAAAETMQVLVSDSLK